MLQGRMKLVNQALHRPFFYLISFMAPQIKFKHNFPSTYEVNLNNCRPKCDFLFITVGLHYLLANEIRSGF